MWVRHVGIFSRIHLFYSLLGSRMDIAEFSVFLKRTMKRRNPLTVSFIGKVQVFIRILSLRMAALIFPGDRVVVVVVWEGARFDPLGILNKCLHG